MPNHFFSGGIHFHIAVVGTIIPGGLLRAQTHFRSHTPQAHPHSQFEDNIMTTFLMIFGAALLAVIVIGYFWLQSVKTKMATAKEADAKGRQARLDGLHSIPLSDREDAAIYQWSFHHGDREVARVVKAEVDEAAKRVSFAEVTHSDRLLLPDECQFQKYKLEVDTVGDAMKVDKMEPDKGRILRNVTAQIIGYVEQ